MRQEIEFNFKSRIAMKNHHHSRVPHEVVDLIADKDWTPVRAWRVYLEVTQFDMADRLGMPRSTYARQEANHMLEENELEAIAEVLGIDVALLML